MYKKNISVAVSTLKPAISVPDANKPSLRPAVRTVSTVRERREALPGTQTEHQEAGHNTGSGWCIAHYYQTKDKHKLLIKFYY